MEASEVLSKAWAAVVDAALPPEIHETAFKAAIQLISPTSAEPQAPRMSTVASEPAAANHGASSGSTSAATGNIFANFAAESNIDQTALEEVFYFDADETPHINVPGRKLGNNNAMKARAIATGLTAARYYVSDQSTLAVEVVRAECQTKGVYDQGNFSAQIASTPGVTVSGTGAARVFRVKANEIEAALRAMVNAVRGVSE